MAEGAAKSEEMGWKLYGGLAAVGATIVARKVVQKAWKMGTGNEPPSNPEDPDVGIMEAVGWAILSGSAVGIARMLAGRKAAERWRKSTGELPPGVRAGNA